jgi:hypothetical protein
VEPPDSPMTQRPRVSMARRTLTESSDADMEANAAEETRSMRMIKTRNSRAWR